MWLFCAALGVGLTLIMCYVSNQEGNQIIKHSLTIQLHQ